jgi:hypothetical protein
LNGYSEFYHNRLTHAPDSIRGIFVNVPRNGEKEMSKKIVNRLGEWRLEWEEAAGDLPLTEVKAPISLILADVASILELTPEETAKVLGDKLTGQLI